MNKSEFVAFIAEKHQIKKSVAENNLNQVIESITEALRQGEEVKITSFGTFALLHRKAREGCHPQTGKKIDIPSYKQPTFKVGKPLKSICNAGR